MFSPIRIDRERQMIIINSAFARKADQYNTQEYSMLLVLYSIPFCFPFCALARSLISLFFVFYN